MEGKRKEILESHEDYMDWEKLALHCRTLDELTELEKEKASRAFRFLGKEFGNDFLKSAFVNYHPIYYFITNTAPWTRRWIIRFADEIKELKDKEKFSSLLERLKDKKKFGEGLSVLKVSYKFSKAGFIVAFDPSVEISGKSKIPDLRVYNQGSDEKLFIEVSIQRESIIHKEAWETMRKISVLTWGNLPHMSHCGRIHKILSEKHLDDIVMKVRKMIEKVHKENEFQELVIEGVIEIGMAPKEDREILEKWASGRGLKVGEFSGPSFDVDEISRTRIKIRDEQQQLPTETPNILVIENNDFFFSNKDIKKSISELEEEVYKYPHLLAVIISGGYTGGVGENKIIMQNQHLFISKIISDLIVEQHIILFNQYCNIKISPTTITKMYDAFRDY